MKVKKFFGATNHEAILKMKKELGPDAVILSTRTVREKGILGFFKKPKVEIVAAFEEKDLLHSQKPSDKFDKINRELNNLKYMVEEISQNVSQKQYELPEELVNYHTKLIENGVEYYTATSILKVLGQQVNLEGKDEQAIRNIVKYTLMEYIGDAKPLDLKKGVQKTIFFIGPTGVGKTTTLAKLAAQLVMENEYDIGLITSDTYRIAAVEQLKIYSDILELPLEVVYDDEDMYKALVTFKDKDIILVDTAGKSHKEIDKDDGIIKTMNSINNKETYLVISGTTNYNTLKSIIHHYEFIEDYCIIFTKIDEAEGYGNILNAKYLTKRPISYITTGQNVPDDIEIFDREKTVCWLIGENVYERSS